MKKRIFAIICLLFSGILCFADMPETKEITIEKTTPARTLNVSLCDGGVEAWIEVDSVLDQDSTRIVVGEVSVLFCKSTNPDTARVVVSKGGILTYTNMELSVVNGDLLYMSFADETLTIWDDVESQGLKFVCGNVKSISFCGSQLCDVSLYVPLTVTIIDNALGVDDAQTKDHQSHGSVKVGENTSDSSTMADLNNDDNTTSNVKNASSEDNSQKIVIVNADYNSGK